MKFVILTLTAQWLTQVHRAAILGKIKNPVNRRFIFETPCICKKRHQAFISHAQFVPVKESVFSFCSIQPSCFLNKTEVFIGSKHLSLPLWVTTTKILPDMNVCQEVVICTYQPAKFSTQTSQFPGNQHNEQGLL